MSKTKTIKEPIMSKKDIENVCLCIGALLAITPLLMIYWIVSYMEYLEAITYGI